MIRRIQALNYRCLRYVDIALDRFGVLVGETGSGKSTLLDAIALLSDLIRDGPRAAVHKRTDDFRDLVWGRPEDNLRFELAAEFEIPDDLRQGPGDESPFQRFRYEIAVTGGDAGPGIETERGILMPGTAGRASPQETLFTDPPPAPASVPSGSRRRGSRTVFSKSATGNDSFNVESAGQGSKGWAVRIALGPRRSTLANLPENPDSFPVATYVRDLLKGQVNYMAFDATGLRRPSPPGRQAESLEPDGSNLPWAVGRLRATDAQGFREWIAQLQTALPQLEDVLVTERQSDRQACLTIRETTGMELPLHAVSDGALRLIAVTLLPRLAATGGIWLVRNETDGLDSPSLQVAFESLSAVAQAQVLVATRSPMFVLNTQASERLHFTRDEEGAANIVSGEELGDPETGGTSPVNLQ